MATHQTGSSGRRRWFSFSLRSLLIVITVVCVWLAIVAAKARRQERSVEKIQRLGGILHFEHQKDAQGRHVSSGEPAAPQWLRTAVGEDYFRRVVTVGLNVSGGLNATDQDLVVFSGLPDVTSLELSNNPITDVGLEHLAGLSKLRGLLLHRSQVRGTGLRHLPPTLEGLDLSFAPLEDAGLAHVKKMTKLKTLDLGHTKITDQGLSNLSGITSLESLRLEHTEVTDAGLEHLRTLATLKQLSIGHTSVSSAGVARFLQTHPNCVVFPDPKWLAAVPQDIELWPDGYKPSTAEVLARIGELGDTTVDVDKSRPGQPVVSFRLFDSTISDDSLIRLLAEMPELEQLNLRRVLVGDRLAKELPRLQKLTFLSLSDSHITDQGLAGVAQLLSLKELDLSNTRVSAAGLIQLAPLKHLDAVHTQGCDLSNEDYARLKQALPKCRVSR